MTSINSNKDYISFPDYHGQAYPNVGVGGFALADFTNPDNIPMQSNPDDWISVGTEFLFVNDELHSYNRPLISFGFDEESGKNYMGYYKGYVIDDLIWLCQVYSNYYGHSIFEDYPVSKNILTSEIWETLPNGYMNNHVTSGNTLETYHKGVLNLFDDSEKGMVLNYIEKTEGKDILPYSSEYERMSNMYWYLVFDKYDNISPNPPTWTNHLNYDSTYQVFRESWEEDSDWLSLITFDGETTSNRDTAHHDQLSIEYYGSGDLLLADAGEDKYVLDKTYGAYASHHNGIALENPRSSYPVSEWADSESRGVFNGNSGGIATPVIIENIVETPWIDILNAKETINEVVGDMWASSYHLSSPIEYSRVIIYPFNDYFILIDKFHGGEEWIYRSIFRPTSQTIIPTLDLNGDNKYSESEIGHVVGDLKIDGLFYNWLKLPYKEETETDIITDNILWSVTSPYGNDVVLNLFSAPASEIIITKHVGRIAGYGYKSEVFSPIVYLRTQPAKDLSRITLLLIGSNVDKIKSAEEIEVNGDGNAVKVYSDKETDYIYSGRGNSEFNHFKTDADIFFTRNFKKNSDEYYLIFGGTFFTKNRIEYINLTDYKGSEIIRVSNLKLKPRSVILDGMNINVSDIFEEDNSSILIDCGGGDHTVDIILENKNVSLIIGSKKIINEVAPKAIYSEIPVIKKYLNFSLFTLILLFFFVFILKRVK